MIRVFLLLFFLNSIQALAHSQDYKFTSTQGEYIELEDFNSLIFQTGGAWSTWHLRIDLEFDFPYFDSTFNYIDATDGGYFGFDGSQSKNILLFTVEQELDEVTDIFNLESDIRYGFRVENGLQCLIVQYTKVRFRNDPSILVYDSYLNYQHCFCEDGSIELRIGDMNVENSPGFSPGEGFYLIFNNGNVLIPTSADIGLANLDDDDKGYFFHGTHDSFQIVNSYFDAQGLQSIPPKGWTFRFEPKPTNVQLIDDHKSNIFIFPNPVDDYLNFAVEGERPKLIRITNSFGRLEMSFTPDNQYVDVANLASGIYHIEFIIGEEIHTRSFLKK